MRLLNDALVAPSGRWICTVEFFPDPYHSTEADARSLMERVCGYMGIDPERICLDFYSEEEPDLGEG